MTSLLIALAGCCIKKGNTKLHTVVSHFRYINALLRAKKHTLIRNEH